MHVRIIWRRILWSVVAFVALALLVIFSASLPGLRARFSKRR